MRVYIVGLPGTFRTYLLKGALDICVVQPVPQVGLLKPSLRCGQRVPLPRNCLFQPGQACCSVEGNRSRVTWLRRSTAATVVGDSLIAYDSIITFGPTYGYLSWLYMLPTSERGSTLACRTPAPQA